MSLEMDDAGNSSCSRSRWISSGLALAAALSSPSAHGLSEEQLLDAIEYLETKTDGRVRKKLVEVFQRCSEFRSDRPREKSKMR